MPGRDPVRARGGYGLPQLGLTAPRASRSAALQQEERTKNEEEEGLGLRRKDKREKVVDELIDCVLFNRPSPLRYIRGGWTSHARKRLEFTSKTLVKFGLVLFELSKSVRFKLAAPCR